MQVSISMRKSVVAAVVSVLSWGCGPISSNPGGPLQVELKNRFTPLELVQRLDPVDLEFTVDGCEAFDAYVVSGDEAQRRQTSLEVQAIGVQTYRASAPVEALRPVNACYGVSADDSSPAQIWLDIVCVTDGRTATSQPINVTYRIAKAVHFASDLDVIFPSRVEGDFWAFGRTGYHSATTAVQVLGAGDVSGVFGRFILPVASGFVGIHDQTSDAVQASDGTGTFDLVGYSAVAYGNSGVGNVFGPSVAASPWDIIEHRRWQGVDLVIGESGSSIAVGNGSDWQPAVTITRVDPYAALNQEAVLLHAFFDEVLLGVSQGTESIAPVILTRDRKTGLGRLRGLDGALLATTPSPLDAPALKATPYVLSDDGSAWAFRKSVGADTHVYVQTRSGSTVSEPIRLTTSKSSAIAFLSDGSLAVGGRDGVDIFAAPTFTLAATRLLHKSGSDVFVSQIIPLADAAMAVVTDDGVQLVNHLGRVVGGAQPFPPECGGRIQREQIVKIGPRQVAVAQPNGVYVFEMSSEDAAQ
jgi:hypothetical protein